MHRIRLDVRVLCLTFVTLTANLSAQYHAPSYRDLTIVRNRPWAKPEFVEFRAGALAGVPGSKDEARSAEDALGVDGHVYWRKPQAFGRPESRASQTTRTRR